MWNLDRRLFRMYHRVSLFSFANFVFDHHTPHLPLNLRYEVTLVDRWPHSPFQHRTTEIMHLKAVVGLSFVLWVGTRDSESYCVRFEVFFVLFFFRNVKVEDMHRPGALLGILRKDTTGVKRVEAMKCVMYHLAPHIYILCLFDNLFWHFCMMGWVKNKKMVVLVSAPTNLSIVLYLIVATWF